MSEYAFRIRKEFAEGDAKRDAGLTTPEGIQRFDNIQYGDDPVWNLLDVYRSKQSTGKLPLIVIVHGGGWVYGTKEVYQFYGMSLAERGFAVVNYTYRLAPEHKFPASLEDTNAVMMWIHEHADQYGFDTENVFAVGDSAGGHLLGMYCAFCTDDQYAAHFPFAAKKAYLPKGIGMNCGAYRLYDEKGSSLREEDRDLMDDLLNSAEERPLVQVSELINRNFPPAFIMSAYGDFLLAQAPLLEERYRALGLPHVLRIYGSESKPLYHVFHCTMQEPAAKICNDEECAFFKSLI